MSEARIVYMSGYTASEVLPAARGARRVGFLPKPSSPREVIAAIHAILDDRVA